MDVPLSPGAIAAKIQRRAALVRAGMILLGLAVAGGAGALAWRQAPPPAEPPAEPPLTVKPEPWPRVRQENPALPAPRPPPVDAARMQQLRRKVLENVWQLNMASIVSECLRLRNLAREWSEAQSTVADLERRIKADQEELAAAQESVLVETTCAEGDRIVAFGTRDFSLLRRSDGARVLHAWMKSWRAGAAIEQLEVLRGDRRLTVYLQFPEETKELLQLVRHPALQLEPLSDVEPAMAAQGTLPVDKMVDLIAVDVSSQTEVFGEVISEMRRRTEPLTTSTVPIWPDESVRGIALIGNPLTFRPGELPAGSARELGAWWTGLSRTERTRFAAFFGLWCAHTRGQAAKK
jgi:hypothetical protein